MTALSDALAFLDIGNTLAAVQVSAPGNRIEELIVYPDVPPVLEALRQEGVHLGILSDRGRIPEEHVNEALERAGLLPFFDRNLILYGPKDSARLFEQVAARVLHLSREETAARQPCCLLARTPLSAPKPAPRIFWWHRTPGSP